MGQEQELIAALKQRDQAALTQVFERYADRIYRLALNVLHDEVQADGVVQNTFISLIEHIDGFEGRSGLGTWLYRVAYNEALGRVRRVRPQVDLDALENSLPMPGNFTDWRDLPEAAMSSQEASQQMQAAIAQLPEALRAVFNLRDVEELSTRQTADILGISEAAVKVRLHRARLALRESLATYFEEYSHV